MSRWIAWILAAATLGLASPVIAEDKPDVPEVSAGTIVAWPKLESAHLDDVPRVWVWLPPSYSYQQDRRFPVLYMHDGQNLFDARLTNYNKEWQIDEAIARMSARDDLREWIVVGIESPKERYKALFPQKLVPHLPADMRAEVDSGRFGGAGVALHADAYLAFLVGEVKSKVDAELRTLPGPADTAVMGSSMGGLISLYAIAEYPDVFGQAAGVSTHLPLVDPEAGDPERRAKAVADAFAAYFATTKLDPAQNRIYIDHGTATLDAFYPPYFAAFDEMMAVNGWSGVAYESRAFFGAEHEENAWAQRVDIPLSFLDRSDP